MILGFIGTGAITAAMVTGLSSEGGPRPAIRLSPRNAELALGLASRFENVSVCASNQAVIDVCDTVVLAVRPQVAEEILSACRFRADHVVISVVAGYPIRRIAALVAPASNISRAIPLPAVAKRRSPIAVHPVDSAASRLFAPLGQVFGIAAEDHLNVFSTATSTLAPYFGFVGCVASWVEGKGIPHQQAREYIAYMFAGLSDRALEQPERTFAELAVDHATPGGLNEQVLGDLNSHGVFQTFTEALDSVHRRATGQQR